MSKLILLTGATGFVGKQVLNALIRKNMRVRLIVREGNNDPCLKYENVESVFYSKDVFIENEIWWNNACTGVDTIIHVAWYAEPGEYLQSPKNIDCLTGTITLAKACINSSVRRFVGVGTCFEYDLTDGLLSVNSRLCPTSIYAATKTAAYLTLSEFFKLQKIQFAWCRLFYLYGEGEDTRRLLPYIKTQLEKNEVVELTSGNQVRDFLNVQVAGEIIANCALGTVQGPFNVCSGVGVTVRELAEQIADEFGRRDLLHFGARPDNFVDPPFVVGVKENNN